MLTYFDGNERECSVAMRQESVALPTGPHDAHSDSR